MRRLDPTWATIRHRRFSRVDCRAMSPRRLEIHRAEKTHWAVVPGRSKIQWHRDPYATGAKSAARPTLDNRRASWNLWPVAQRARVQRFQFATHSHTIPAISSPRSVHHSFPTRIVQGDTAGSTARRSRGIHMGRRKGTMDTRARMGKGMGH